MSNIVRKFPKEEIWSDGWWNEGKVRVVKDDLVETNRWSEIHDVVFLYDDTYYRTSYSQGLTEYQDERPFEYETEIVAIEVRQVEKTVKVWEAVQDG